jgi:acyl carrier protein
MMTMPEWPENKIFENIKSILSDALEVEPEIVTPGSLVIDELGAESIDILDISFRIEKTFNLDLSNQSFSIDSKDIPKGKKASEIFTVQMIVDFVKSKLEEAKASA